MSVLSIVRSLANKKQSDLLPPLSDAAELQRISTAYRGELPVDLVTLYNFTAGGFIQVGDNDSWRLLSPQDIMDADSDWDVDFVGSGKMPLIDCKDNNFICYDVERRVYVMMNIVDGMVFDEAKSLQELFNRKLGST